MTPPTADLPRPLALQVITVFWHILGQGSMRALSACAVILAVPGALLLAGLPALRLAQLDALIAHQAVGYFNLLTLVIGLRGLWMLWRVIAGERGFREGDAFVLGLCGLLFMLPLTSLKSLLLTVVIFSVLFSAISVLSRPWRHRHWVQAQRLQPWPARGLL